MKKVGAQSQAELEQMLIAQGLTLERFRKRLREQLMVQRLTRRKVVLRISVTEQEIDRYLAQNREKLETGLTFEARHMLFLPEAGQRRAGWDAARRKAGGGPRPARWAAATSASSRRSTRRTAPARTAAALGTLKRGELAPEIEEAILALQPGQVSSPFRSAGRVSPLPARLAPER